jgi:hypothetical protein
MRSLLFFFKVYQPIVHFCSRSPWTNGLNMQKQSFHSPSTKQLGYALMSAGSLGLSLSRDQKESWLLAYIRLNIGI